MIPQKKVSRHSAGTFHKMGLSVPLLRGIQSMGYKLPTPIQRKCIPIILDGHDIVAMARTGSGKSAAFLIPLISSLKQHSLRFGCRGLILSPTRDLALQTGKFAKSLSKYLDLRICVIIGGESVESQFDALSFNPDIIIATPGRISYLLKEINTFNLKSIKYLIFDEADRLFEMGFALQLKIIINNINNNGGAHKKTQNMLFSATMPKGLIHFTRASLINPICIRLDTECKISPNLKLSYLYCRHNDKLALLLYLLQKLVSFDKLILIFAATRYHVELIQMFLKLNDLQCVSCFGSMEQQYRNLNINKFRKKEINIMIVTDLASRGIDIPLLDYVINYQITTTPKSFIHRVGRVARNGKYGIAISIIQHNELPYIADIYRCLGHILPTTYNYNNNNNKEEEKEEEEEEEEEQDELFKTVNNNNNNNNNNSNDLFVDKISFGMVPHSFLLPFIECMVHTFRKNDDLNKMLEICTKAMDIYNRTKSKPTKYGIYAAKQINYRLIHPFFAEKIGKTELKTHEMLNKISLYKSNSTVFEIGGGANPNYNMMQRMKKKKESINKKQNGENEENEDNVDNKNKYIKYRDNEYFIETQCEERGNNEFIDDMLMINNNNNDKLKQFIMELDEDEQSVINKKKKLYRFNPNSRKYVTEYMGDRINRFLTEKNESSANIKNGNNHQYGKLYKEWKLRSKRDIAINGSYEEKGNQYKNNNKLMGLRKHRHIKGSNEYYEKQRAQKRIKAIRNESVQKEKSKKEKMKKFKREKFRKWWVKNKERVKMRKSKRRMRAY